MKQCVGEGGRAARSGEERERIVKEFPFPALEEH